MPEPLTDERLAALLIGGPPPPGSPWPRTTRAGRPGSLSAPPNSAAFSAA
jgi:hypothetical protein